MKLNLKNTPRLFLTYYTFRALLMHAGFLLGRLPNTRLIAIFVLIVSQIFFFMRPNYYKHCTITSRNCFFELLLHWTPVIVLPVLITKQSIILLIGTLLLYLIVHGKKNITRYYTHQYETTREIMYS